jgi:hypothetical protein
MSALFIAPRTWICYTFLLFYGILFVVTHISVPKNIIVAHDGTYPCGLGSSKESLRKCAQGVVSWFWAKNLQ